MARDKPPRRALISWHPPPTRGAGGAVRVLAGPRWKDVRVGGQRLQPPPETPSPPAATPGSPHPAHSRRQEGRAQRGLGPRKRRLRSGAPPRPATSPLTPLLPSPPDLPQACAGDTAGRGWRNPAPEKQRRPKPAEDPGRSPEGCGPLTSHGSTWPAAGPSVCPSAAASARLSGTV